MKIWILAGSLILPVVVFAVDVIEQDRQILQPSPGQLPQPQSRPDTTPDQLPPDTVGQASAVGPTFTVRKFVIEGATVMGDADFQPYYSDYLNRPVTMSDIQALTQTLKRLYRDRGYLLVEVLVPEQTLADDQLRLSVIEGFIANITGMPDHSGQISHIVRPVQDQRPLQTETLEKSLLLVNDLPGVEVRSTLLPSATVGAADLQLDIKETRFAGGIEMDTSGNKFIGPYRLRGDLHLYTQGRYASATALTAEWAYSDELYGLGLQHGVTVSEAGDVVTASYYNAHTLAGSTLAIFDLDGELNNFRLGWQRYIRRSRAQNIQLSAGFEMNHSDLDSLGVALVRDKLRVFEAGIVWDFADSGGGVNLLQARLRKGIDIMNSSDNPAFRSRFEGETDFTKLQLYLARNQPVATRLNLLMQIQAQLSFDQVLSSEEFTVGGKYIGRGYDNAELGGDHGLSLALELAYEGDSQQDGQGWSTYGFYDIGKVWEKDAGPGIGSYGTSLASIGGGVRFRVWDKFTGFVQIAQPLTHKIVSRNDKDTQFDFQLRYWF